MKKHSTTVLIVGGSVAGLAAANLLERSGVDFLLLEKHKEVAPNLGACIVVFPNGARILDQLGCWDAVVEILGECDTFRRFQARDIRGRLSQDIRTVCEELQESFGYRPVFFERQKLVQVLYDNLKDKSKVLTGRAVVHLESDEKSVRATTSDGEVFTGAILIGADGIHSSTRREMWRIADEMQPHWFDQSERGAVPTQYCCIFGISSPNSNFQWNSCRHVEGEGHSYLVGSGIDQKVYWNLFVKLRKTTHGLGANLPRFTKEEMDDLAMKHFSDMICDDLSFGDLYKTRTMATLQALPEVVFSKWHFGRIITIGDAAHKYNPIGGQGGMSALEDAAVLTNELLRLQPKGPENLSATEVADAFQRVSESRLARTRALCQKAQSLQRIKALDGLVSRLLARYVAPLIGPEATIKRFAASISGAPRSHTLKVPERAQTTGWRDAIHPPVETWPPYARAVVSIATVSILATLLMLISQPSKSSWFGQQLLTFSY